jgi:hypothetical protein
VKLLYYFAFSILVLSIIAFFCFINILIYFSILYIIDKKIMDRLSKNTILLRIATFYKQTRVYYIVIEVIFFIISLGTVISLCLKLINGLT